jgi:ABC-type uncharacterized transport system substrate-binding protein
MAMARGLTVHRLAAALSCAMAVAVVSSPVIAHPHVTVTHTASLVFDKGTIVAIDHAWYFDEFYSAMAVDGLDTNKDGTYSREELADLAKTNAEGLKDFDYFTHPTLANKPLKVVPPTTYWSEFKDGMLSLQFRLPLEQAVLADAKGFAFAIYDPSYFIAFDLAKKDAVKLDGAPKGCALAVGVPKQEADQAKKLSDSFFEQLGSGAGLGIAKTITLTCGGK